MSDESDFARERAERTEPERFAVEKLLDRYGLSGERYADDALRHERAWLLHLLIQRGLRLIAIRVMEEQGLLSDLTRSASSPRR